MSFEKQTYSDEEQTLVMRAAQGDLEAFNQLVLKYQHVAYGHAYALLNDSAWSEDASQEGFIKAFQNIRDFRGGSFRAWLLKIITNSAYDILRRSRRHPTQPLFPEDEQGEEVESPAWLADPSASVQQTVEQAEFSRELYKVVDELSEAYRSVITLVDINELDYTEAAEALGIPIGTVKSRLARARMQIKKKLRSVTEIPVHFADVQATCSV
jgi:RNA polymerase sigma-70 factor (ECF subfamily)